MTPEQFDTFMNAFVVSSGIGIFNLSVIAGLSW